MKLFDWMKFLLVTFLCAIPNVKASEDGPSWQVSIRVVDTEGVSVEGARVSDVYPWNASQIATGKKDTRPQSTQYSNEQGHAKLEGNDYSDKQTVHVSKEGYYQTTMVYKFDRTRLGRWMPWNPTIEVELKEIRDPIPMYVKEALFKYPAYGEDVGFDLLIGDWVSPHGKGEVADLVFNASVKGEYLETYEHRVTITFPRKGDGIQEGESKVNGSSRFVSLYEAPEDGYNSKWNRFVIREKKLVPVKTNTDRNRIFYFRIRSELDAQGNVARAYYGKMYGDFPHLDYYLNPDKTSRNIEFDPKKNLFEEDPDLPRWKRKWFAP